MKRILKFLVTGGTAFTINLSILYTAVEVFGLWYLFAATISFIVATSFNFTAQRLWVFENRERQNFEKHLAQFFVIAVTGTAVNALAMYTLVDVFGLWYMLAQVLIAGSLALVNFFLYGKIFGSPPGDTLPDEIRS